MYEHSVECQILIKNSQLNIDLVVRVKVDDGFKSQTLEKWEIDLVR